MENVLLINKHVENVLEDKPSREEVLDFVDEIKSLEVKDSKITYAITSKNELFYIRNLWRFIHTSELYVDSDRIFFYQLPKPLFDWLNAYNLREIIDQIQLYNAFLSLSSYNYPKVKEHTFSLLRDLLLKNIDLIKSQHVPFSFIKKTLEDGILSQYQRLEERDKPLLQYLYIFYNKYGSYPIKPLLQTDPNPDYPIKDPFIANTEWERFTEGFYLKFKIYGSQKFYLNLRNSRLTLSPDGKEYNNEFLNVWKYFYVNDFDILDNIFENVKVVSCYAKKTNFSWVCKRCKEQDLDFEYEKQAILDEHEMDMLCKECYMYKIFKILS